MSEQKRDLNIIGKRWWFFLISGTVIIAGVIALIAFGLKPGVEFKSGTEVTISFTDNTTSPSKAQVTAAISNLGYDSGSYLVRKAGNDYILSLPELNDQGKVALRTALTEQVGPFKDGGFYTVSAIAAGQTVRNASIAGFGVRNRHSPVPCLGISKDAQSAALGHVRCRIASP